METLGCYKIIHPSPIRCFSGGYVSFRAAKPCTIVSTKTSAVCKPEAPGRIQTGAECKMSLRKQNHVVNRIFKKLKKTQPQPDYKKSCKYCQVIFLQIRLSTAMATKRAECLTALQDDSTEGARLQAKTSARGPPLKLWYRQECQCPMSQCPMSLKPVNSCKFSIFRYLNMIFRCIWMCHLHVCSNCALQRANAILKNDAWACKRMSVTLRSHFAANSGLSALKMQTSADLSLENLQKRLWTSIGGVSQSAGMATFCKLRIASCEGRLQKLNTYQNYQPGKQIDWNNMEENANAKGKVTILAANSRIEIRKYFWYPLFD